MPSWTSPDYWRDMESFGWPEEYESFQWPTDELSSRFDVKIGDVVGYRGERYVLVREEVNSSDGPLVYIRHYRTEELLVVPSTEVDALEPDRRGAVRKFARLLRAVRRRYLAPEYYRPDRG